MEWTELLSQIAESRGARVKLVDETTSSPWSHAECAYWEWVAGRPAAEEALASIEDRNRSTDEITLSFAGSTAKFPVNVLRIHASPSFERAVAERDEVEGDTLAEDIPEDVYPIKVLEHCLAQGRDYFAFVENVTIDLPSGQDKRWVLHLSESPFIKGETDAELTPRSASLGF